MKKVKSLSLLFAVALLLCANTSKAQQLEEIIYGEVVFHEYFHGATALVTINCTRDYNLPTPEFISIATPSAPTVISKTGHASNRFKITDGITRIRAKAIHPEYYGGTYYVRIYIIEHNVCITRKGYLKRSLSAPYSTFKVTRNDWLQFVPNPVITGTPGASGPGSGFSY